MFGQSTKNILVAGHRGLKTFYPENTMVSFRAALDAGVDMIETDLRLSLDEELVIIHDESVDRTTDASGKVNEFTLKELKKLDAGSKFSSEFIGERVITFDEFLEFAKPTRLSLNIEIKDFTHKCVDKAIKALTDAGLQDRFVITCWSAAITSYAHEKYGVPTQGFPSRFMIDSNNKTYSHLYSVGVNVDWLEESDCKKEKFSKQDIDYWTWCPDTEDDVVKCINAGTTLMTCNNPFPALKVLRERKLHK